MLLVKQVCGVKIVVYLFSTVLKLQGYKVTNPTALA